MTGGALDDLAIARCFERCFAATAPVRCLGGANEPLYRPATAAHPAELVYREDFAASALHEIAHWCVAGARRRQLPDFGYRYLPPPRTAAEQARFLRWELMPQALESLFADAAGIAFRASFDDVEDQHVGLRQPFLDSLALRRKALVTAMPPRAERFLKALRQARLAAAS
jgi:elongation factor P hydroxylase